MNPREIQAVAGILDAFTRADSVVATQQSMLDELCRLGDLRGGHFINLNALYEGQCWENLSSGENLDLGKFDREHQHYVHVNPVMHLQRTLGPDRPVYRHRDLLGEKGWNESEFCRDFTRRYDMLDGVVMLLHDSDANLRWAFAGGHANKGGVKQSYARVLRALAPVLSRAMSNLERWHTELKRQGSVMRLLEAVRDAVALVAPGNNERGPRLLAATPAALEMMGAHACARSSNPAVTSFIEAARRIVGRAIPWTDCRGRRCVLSAIRTAASPGEPDTILIRIEIETSAPAKLARNRLVKAGLSNQEMKVLLGAARGLGDKQIGRELDLSVHTIRAYLRKIYGKLNVNGRVEAISVAIRFERPNLE